MPWHPPPLNSTPTWANLQWSFRLVCGVTVPVMASVIPSTPSSHIQLSFFNCWNLQIKITNKTFPNRAVNPRMTKVTFTASSSEFIFYSLKCNSNIAEGKGCFIQKFLNYEIKRNNFFTYVMLDLTWICWIWLKPSENIPYKIMIVLKYWELRVSASCIVSHNRFS